MIDSYKGKACLKKEEVVTVTFSSVCLICFLTFFSKFSCCKARFFLEYPDFLTADLRKALKAFCGNASTQKTRTLRIDCEFGDLYDFGINFMQRKTKSIFSWEEI